MLKKKLIVGNWKMNPRSLALARTNFLAIKKGMDIYKNLEVAIAAPFIYLPELSKLTSAKLSLGSQNVASAKEGPYTGEVSADMLKSFKIKYAIVGHSERRALGETNAQINLKLKMLLAAKITPILCVGETDRDASMWYLSAVKTQLEECLAGISKNAVPKIVIAYEPVWAISTTVNHRDATTEDCREMIIYIRKVLSDMVGHSVAQSARVIYGGSVNEDNARGFLSDGMAQGLLPGKASLKPTTFIKILNIANAIN